MRSTSGSIGCGSLSSACSGTTYYDDPPLLKDSALSSDSFAVLNDASDLVDLVCSATLLLSSLPRISVVESSMALRCQSHKLAEMCE